VTRSKSNVSDILSEAALRHDEITFVKAVKPLNRLSFSQRRLVELREQFRDDLRRYADSYCVIRLASDSPFTAEAICFTSS
jgi:hypothetical protein